MRVIARLDIKNDTVIKGIRFEGLRVIGEPVALAGRYASEGADEILLMDSVASLYDRRNVFHILERACEDVFVPITIGGGLRQMSDVAAALHAGADKVAINTAAVRAPGFITEVATTYGSQCVVASVEAKRSGDRWEAYVDNGRGPTGLDLVEWTQQLEQLGAGEVLLTSVDQDGTQKGFDVDLIAAVNAAVRIPVIASGGLGSAAHLRLLCGRCSPSAIAMASALHYNKLSIADAKAVLSACGADVRQ